jgi:pimeloyl-ACP methyl ester carboxylesterase
MNPDPAPGPDAAEGLDDVADVTGTVVRTADGRLLHLHGRGEGEDLVVLEAGLGAGGASWGALLEEPPKGARVLAYDRAGYGESTPAPGPRDLGALVTDLLAVVDAVEHERLILVGHSWGGPIVRGAAAQLRGRGRPVTGVVLVDPAEELADLYFTRTARAMSGVQGAVMPMLSRLGLLAPLQRAAAGSVPAPWRDAAAASVSTPAAAQAVRAESRHMTAGLLGLRLDPPPPLGTAVSVISGRLPEGLGRRMRDELTDAHRARAEAEGGHFVAAENSGHVIAASEPELIAGEIRRMLEA